MITLADDEKAIASAIKQLSDQAGSHSPSIFTIAEGLPQLEIESNRVLPFSKSGNR